MAANPTMPRMFIQRTAAFCRLKQLRSRVSSGMVLMTFIEPTIIPQTRFFPSRIALLAATELVLIALLLRLSNSPAFFAAAIACSLCSIQLGILLINRFQVNTRQIRKVARQAEFSSQSVIITNAFGRIKWTNPRFTRLTGFYLSEIAGKTFGDGSARPGDQLPGGPNHPPAHAAGPAVRSRDPGIQPRR